MGNLDGIDAGLIQRPGDCFDMIDAIAMANGPSHAVAQGDILDIEPVAVWVEPHATASARRAAAIFSAVARAADVMMSRLPA